MDSRARPTGRHFLIRPLEWERIRALKGTPHYERHVRRAQGAAAALVQTPLRPWDAVDQKNCWTQFERYRGLLDAATLCQLQGDEALAQACRRDVMTVVGVSEANEARLLSQSSIEETFICRALLFCHEWLSEIFTQEERERIRQTCLRTMPHHAWEMARSTVNQKLVQNHLLLDSTGLALVSLYFNDFGDAARWGHFAAETAERYMREAFHADGGQNEVANSYHYLCLEIGLLLSQVLRDFGGRDPLREEGFRGVMERALDWLAALVTPAGSVVALGDSMDRVPSWFFRFGASQFRNPHFQALADKVEQSADAWRPNLLFDLLYYEPSVPARLDPTARGVFPVSGTAVCRSGLGAQDGLLALNAGSYVGGHAHHDRLGFEYWHHGQGVLLDVGGQGDDWAAFVGYNKQSSAHNVVAIHEPHELRFEGKYQGDESFPVEHRSHLKSQGRILQACEESTHAVLVSQADIYAGVRQKRTLVWCKASGVLWVRDEVASERAWPFDQLFHGPGELVLEGTSFLFRDKEVSLAGSVLAPAQPELIAIPRPPKAKGAPAYVAVRVHASRVDFLTVLEPYAGAHPPVRRLNASGELRLESGGGKLDLNFHAGDLVVKLDGREIFKDCYSFHPPSGHLGPATCSFS